MKKQFLVIIALFAAITFNFGQVKEGHFTYTIEMSSDNPDMQMAIGMMQGSTMDLYMMPEKSRVEVKMGALMTMTTIVDSKQEKMLLLMGGMMGNNAIPSTFDDLKANDSLKSDIKVELVNETKKVAGYDCKKALVSDEEGNSTVFWYTEEIQVEKEGHMYLNKEVPGFPMEYDINQNGMIMKMTVTKVETKLDKTAKKTLFSLDIPEGYKEMTMEEMQTMGM